MCRNIKTLHNFKPPATEAEIEASALQFVRKLSGFARPSKTNQLAFDRAVDQVATAAHELLASLVAQDHLAPVGVHNEVQVIDTSGEHNVPSSEVLIRSG